jgi:carbon storage regulator
VLILSRKEGERIHIADNIVIEVHSIRGNSVRLAIDAPKEIKVLRGELKPKSDSDGKDLRERKPA